MQTKVELRNQLQKHNQDLRNRDFIDLIKKDLSKNKLRLAQLDFILSGCKHNKMCELSDDQQLAATERDEVKLKVDFAELEINCDNLLAFIKSSEYKSLHEDDRHLLSLQYGAMSEYSCILMQRLERMEEVERPFEWGDVSAFWAEDIASANHGVA